MFVTPWPMEARLAVCGDLLTDVAQVNKPPPSIPSQPFKTFGGGNLSRAKTLECCCVNQLASSFRNTVCRMPPFRKYSISTGVSILTVA